MHGIPKTYSREYDLEQVANFHFSISNDDEGDNDQKDTFTFSFLFQEVISKYI